MPSAYSSSLRLELQATGENSNSWGTKTNNNLNLIEQAISGYEAITLVSASSTYNLTIADASSSPGRNAFIELRGTVASAISIVVPDVEKGYWVKNSATGSPLTFRTSSGTGFVLPSNSWVFIITDGASAFPVITSGTGYAVLADANTFTNANTFASAVNIQANTSITGNLLVSGAATFASVVDIKGAASLAGILRVGGAATFGAAVSVSGNFQVSGAVVLASVLEVRSTATFRNSIVVSSVFTSGQATLDSALLRLSLGGTLADPGVAMYEGTLNVAHMQRYSVGGYTEIFDVSKITLAASSTLVFEVPLATSRMSINSTKITFSLPTRFTQLGAAPASPVAGEVYYDTSTNKLRCYNGTTWNDLF